MNDEIKKKLNLKIAISKIKEEERIAMSNKKKIIFKNIGIAACIFASLTGVAFAGSKIYENIWKEPRKIGTAIMEITQESKIENITENEAKEIAIQKLNQIGFNTNIVGTDHYKEADSNKIIYRFITEDEYLISIDGKNAIFFNISDNSRRNYTTTISKAEAIKKANEYYKLFGFQSGEYEIADVLVNNALETDPEEGENVTIIYSKKYGERYNPFEVILISIESNTERLGALSIENVKFDNNEIIITEEQAKNIAIAEDREVENMEIESIKVEQKIVKVNVEAYKRKIDKEAYYNEIYNSSERIYYEVEPRVRNAWVVVITYKDEFDDIKLRYTRGKYSYFVDCTTGEIIGGQTMEYKSMIDI